MRAEAPTVSAVPEALTMASGTAETVSDESQLWIHSALHVVIAERMPAAVVECLRTPAADPDARFNVLTAMQLALSDSDTGLMVHAPEAVLALLHGGAAAVVLNSNGESLLFSLVRSTRGSRCSVPGTYALQGALVCRDVRLAHIAQGSYCAEQGCSVRE
eukprot:1459938-Rhodomonas_salina.2